MHYCLIVILLLYVVNKISCLLTETHVLEDPSPARPVGSGGSGEHLLPVQEAQEQRQVHPPGALREGKLPGGETERQRKQSS